MRKPRGIHTMQMKYNRFYHFNNQKGFTLVELIVVIGVILAIITMSFGATRELVRWTKEIETKKRFEELRRAIQTVYKQNTWEVDSRNTNTFVFTVNGVQYTLSNGMASDPGNLAALQAIASIHGLIHANVDRDSMNQVLLVHVSNRLHDASSGASYRVVAISTPGWDFTNDSLFNQDNGILSISKDDIGFAVSGLQYQIDNIRDTMVNMRIIRDLYQNHFTALFRQSVDKNIFVNRLANRDIHCNVSPHWDQTSQIRNTNCVGNPTMTNVGMAAAFGLTTDSIMSAWGRELRIDNHSASTRNPSTTGLSIPYTALVLAELPWGGNLTVTVNGIY